MRYISMVCVPLMALLMLASSGAMAQNKALIDVNSSCGTEIITECAFCHYDTGGITPEQEIYLTSGACGFCPEVAACSSAPPTVEQLLVDAQLTTNAYFETLFKEFMWHMMQTGMMDPDGTITNPAIFAEVFPKCPEIAPVIASNFSRLTGNLVRRVTNRTRNSRNNPDDWELEQLMLFEEKAANGEPRTQFNITKPDGSILPTKEFEAFAIVVEGTDKDKDKIKAHDTGARVYFRYMRSITMPGLPTEPPHLPCLKCHGTFDQLGPGVADAVLSEYPHDQAMGYKKGDIRGAWSVKIPLDALP